MSRRYSNLHGVSGISRVDLIYDGGAHMLVRIHKDQTPLQAESAQAGVTTHGDEDQIPVLSNRLPALFQWVSGPHGMVQQMIRPAIATNNQDWRWSIGATLRSALIREAQRLGAPADWTPDFWDGQ